MDQLIEINSLEEYEKAIQTKSIILFTASWCPDCMFIKPFIGNVVKKYPNFTFYSINRDHFIDLCQDLDILGIPSFVSYENGQETGRFVSKLRKRFILCDSKCSFLVIESNDLSLSTSDEFLEFILGYICLILFVNLLNSSLFQKSTPSVRHSRSIEKAPLITKRFRSL